MSHFPQEIEEKMISHMNEDHIDAMQDYCRFAGVDIGNTKPEMTAIDQNGFELSVNGESVKFQFDQECATPQEVRQALVELAKKSRQ